MNLRVRNFNNTEYTDYRKILRIIPSEIEFESIFSSIYSIYYSLNTLIVVGLGLLRLNVRMISTSIIIY